MTTRPTSLFEPAIVRSAALGAFRKLDPRHVARNPVMFLVEVGSVVVTVLFVKDFGDSSTQANLFAGLIAAWLWVTVLFANFAEAMAEGRACARPVPRRSPANGSTTAPSSRCRAPVSSRATWSSSPPAS